MAGGSRQPAVTPHASIIFVVSSFFRFCFAVSFTRCPDDVLPSVHFSSALGVQQIFLCATVLPPAVWIEQLTICRGSSSSVNARNRVKRKEGDATAVAGDTVGGRSRSRASSAFSIAPRLVCAFVFVVARRRIEQTSSSPPPRLWSQVVVERSFSPH